MWESQMCTVLLRRGRVPLLRCRRVPLLRFGYITFCYVMSVYRSVSVINTNNNSNIIKFSQYFYEDYSTFLALFLDKPSCKLERKGVLLTILIWEIWVFEREGLGTYCCCCVRVGKEV